MKIKIQREGGFIGITSKANLEYKDLTAEEQNALDSLAELSLKVDDAPKMDIPSKTLSAKTPIADVPTDIKKEEETQPKSRGIAEEDKPKIDEGLEFAGNAMPHNMPSSMMRDGFSYSISMKKNGKTVSLKFDDMTAPPEIVQIFQKYVQY